MCVPTCFSWNLVAFHCPVSWNHILDNSGECMSYMRLSVGCRRSVIEHICRSILSVFDTLLKNMVFTPKLFNFSFSLYKLQICRYLFIHKNPFFVSRIIKKTCPCNRTSQKLINHLYNILSYVLL